MKSGEVQSLGLEDVQVVVLEGELRVAQAGRLREQLLATIATGTGHVVLDLERESLIDASVVGVLVGAMNRLGEEQPQLRLAAPSALCAGP